MRTQLGLLKRICSILLKICYRVGHKAFLSQLLLIHLILILHVTGVEQLFTLYIVEHVTLFRFKNTFLHLQLPSCFLGRSIISLFPSTAQLHLALQNRGKVNKSIQFFFPNTNLNREIMLHN